MFPTTLALQLPKQSKEESISSLQPTRPLRRSSTDGPLNRRSTKAGAGSQGLGPPPTARSRGERRRPEAQADPPPTRAESVARACPARSGGGQSWSARPGGRRLRQYRRCAEGRRGPGATPTRSQRPVCKHLAKLRGEVPGSEAKGEKGSAAVYRLSSFFP